ncbi:hypothetical protein GOP47_0003994 [Adiantum capillus-veneris]|uniref:Uncharacterized protein n=1 Tax=Adiantum capillus-veneris TaxID=13818 RepID=A0A9D4V7S8_ADICA|nr:hypothetical protein GOP47_0003994 [Adiantum capillus-veneris]
MATMEVDLGNIGLVHAIQTPRGVMFSMSEVASTIFHENPSAFAKELRQGRYNKQHIEDKNILETLARLNVFPDSSTSIGATLLSPRTLEELLNDTRKFDLVPILKVALMRMVTQQSATLMAQGELENALSLALDAIKQAQQIFYPKAPLQMVPLYLLAVQVCLSLGRSTQCEELLGIAAWLFLQGPQGEENYDTQAEISRLFGQLYVLQNKFKNALQAFAEEIYYVSKEHGVLDIRTSIGFYNSFKVLKTLERYEDCLAFGDVVVDIWLLVMGGLVLSGATFPSKTFGNLDPEIVPDLRNSQENIRWVHVDDMVTMLQDILGVREHVLGVTKASGEEIFLAIGLIYVYKKDLKLALENLNKAQKSICGDSKTEIQDMLWRALLSKFDAYAVGHASPFPVKYFGRH